MTLITSFVPFFPYNLSLNLMQNSPPSSLFVILTGPNSCLMALFSSGAAGVCYWKTGPCIVIRVLILGLRPTRKVYVWLEDSKICDIYI